MGRAVGGWSVRVLAHRRLVLRLRIWGRALRLKAHPSGAREFRTTAVLAAVFVLSAFDLAFTNSQVVRGNFAEANILAASVAAGPTGMAAYKVLLFGFGAVVLYRYRRRWISEAGVWCLLLAYSGLMVWWLAYLDALEVCLGDPAIVGGVAAL
jgi:hypothetical protein